ncbi:MAG: carbohydrate ABC transporter permease, partial [Mesorhizobium sp.]
GLHNTLTGLVCVYVTLQLPFSIFMKRNAFDAVPREIEEAALVEGCSRLRVFTRITLPMMRAPLASAALFVFILNWSDYLIALLLTTREWVTVPVYMASLSSSMTGQLYGAKAALGLIAAVPPVIMGIAIQRHLVRGLTFGALKQ